MSWRRASRAVVGLACLAGLIGCGGDEPAGASGSIEIIIDDMGVPHIYADRDEDLFYGYGYQLASDRMLQIEMWRRFAFGRRSEILGGSFQGSFGATTLQDDKLVRLFNLPHFGRLDAELMRSQHPERWRLVQAWRAGINRRVEEVRDGSVPRPFGFGQSELDFLPEPWDADDPFIIQKMIQLGLDQSLLFEILVTLIGQLKPETLAAIQLFKPARPAWTLPPEDAPIGAAASAAAKASPASMLPAWPSDPTLFDGLIGGARPGSNNWAIDGRFTAGGKPMIAGDPHLVFTLMGAMYAVHLSGGSYDVAGFAFAPAPGIFAGHTRGALWTPTSAFGDVMDLWAVELSDQGARIGDQVAPVVEREELIELRDGSSEAVTIRDVPGFGVIFEPLLAGVPIPLTSDGRSVLLGWTGFKARSSLYFLELDRAQSVEQLEAAIDRIPEMSYNWLGADASSICYRVSLEIPKRAPIVPGREPWRVMDGNDPLAFWSGESLPPEKLPSGRARQRGWIATANNDPFGFTADGDPANDAWYYGAFFDPGYRAQRIHEELERLSQQGNVTLEQMQTLQVDVRSLMSDDFIELLADAWANVGLDPALAEFSGRPELATLVKLIAVDWDRRMLRESPGALAFHAFAHFVTARTAEDDLLSLLYERVLEAAPFYLLKVAVMALRGEFPDGEKLLQEGRDRLVLLGLADTAAFLEQRFGSVAPESYRWGDLHITAFDNAFGLGMPLGSAPTDGGEDTINVAHSLFRKDGESWISDYGPVERMVGRFSEAGTPEIWVSFLPGNVADPASPHFDDLLEDWIEGRYRKLAFSRAEVEARSERRFEIIRR
jgi:penicillin G amidase